MNRQTLKVISFNVNGILNPVKRRQILTKMKRENAQIVFLQETHLIPSEHEKLKRMGFSRVYYSSYKSGHRRGVATLISQQIPFEQVSEISDKEGRYIIVTGKIHDVIITICNIYAPPGSNFSFYRNIFDLMIGGTGVVICGGDFNIRLNPKQDSSRNQVTTRLHRKINALLTELGVLDLWRNFYPSGRDYTFYSHPHDVYSRIDYFFVLKRDRHRIRDCDIGCIDLSDHAPLSCTVDIIDNPGRTLWRLNTNILNNPRFKTQMREEIKRFLEENDNGEVDSTIVWDTLKAVIRGRIISFCAYEKKQKQLRLIDLNKKLKDLETQHKREQKTETLTRIKAIRNEINIIYTQEIEKKMIFTKQTYYESGAKSLKILARKLQKQQADNTIYKIKDIDSKTIQYKQEEIQRTFRKYYKCLYTQPQLEGDQKIEDFLKSLNLPAMSGEQNEILSAPITEIELNKAISTLKANKSPGPDGFSSEWYKAFRAELMPTLLQACNTTLTDAKMPPSWNEAVISVIPKEGKSKLECSSYRPISVLNVDYKLYTTILARRLDKVLPQLIHNDQTGFISQRQTHDNIRRSLHILHHIQENNIEACLVSLDAEKAFDSVSWPFLYKVLERFGMDNIFIRGIRTLYNKPSAQIKINGYLSDTMILERGTRQGCPLSPLLFALYIEPLAQWIRQTQSIKGISINGEDHKVALYADDVLVYLNNPLNSLPKLMVLLETFGNYSGYKLNIQKTQILTVNYQPTKQLREKFHINWDQNSLKYLGINLPKRIQTLAEINYGPLLAKIKEDIHRWNTISFLGLSHRIDSVRMNILPRYLFLFQALPIEISSKQFSELNKIISRFIWQGKKPRVRFNTLQLPKEQGGMALPNFKDYFYAAQIRPLINLCNPSFQARWKDIELSTLVDPPVQAILPQKHLGKCIDKVQNPWIKVQLKIWNMIRDEYKLNKLQTIQWCAYDPEFKPNAIDKRFKSWILKGITTYHSLTEKGQLKNFEKLKEDYNLEKTDFFRFLQVRNRFEHIRKETDLNDPILTIFIDAYQSKSNKGVISRIYKGLLSKKPHNTGYVKEKWEREGNLLISEDDWFDICKSQWKCTSSHVWREFGWKCMIRFFITPKQKTHFTGGEATCWRQCGHREANHWHIFWECPAIKSFWTELHKVLRGIFNTNLPMQFSTLFLGNLDLQVRRDDEYLFGILITAGKKALTRHWLLPDPPTIQEWIGIVNDIYLMEKITFSLRLQKNTFIKLWAKWVGYANNEQTEVLNG